jgi:ATP/maltotriose-dependent transcriptional regulator MalT
VSRPALAGRLAEAERVVHISAPTGSGKTVLMRSWIAEAGLARHAAWVPVDREVRDPRGFWISVADALRRTAAGSALVRPLTAAPDLDGWAVVDRLLTDLAPLEDRLWLVIDDAHLLGSGEVLAQLELLLLRTPPELRLVVATRHDLRLGLHRLRLEGDLTEIRAADLRFSLAEARALFGATGLELPGDALARLHARTEGWAAGLRLAALSLAGHPDPERFAAEFSGTDRTVAEFLLAEVLDRQSEEARRLLLRTSVLDRVSGPLADVLTGRSGGERILQDLEQAGAFVVSLDASRSWFRYHQLFADLLQLELRRTEPNERAGLHRAAAGWLAEHGHPVEAVRQAQAAEDWATATRLLSDRWLDLYLGGRGAILVELLAGFPARLAAASPELTAVQVAGDLVRGSLEDAGRHLAASAEPGDVTAVQALAEAAESLGVTDPGASADIASVALSLVPSRHPLRGPLVARRTVSLFAAGRSEEARAFADHALRQSLPAEQEADVRLSLAAMFVISADDRADNARQGLSLTDLSADTRARLWASLFHNLLVAGRLEEGLAIESEVRTNVFASTDLAARYFFQIGRSAMEYQLGRFELSLRLLQGVNPERLAGFDDPRERLTHSYRSWLLSALDRVDEAIAVAEDGLASARRDRQNWAVHLFETWKGRHLLQLGRLDEADAVLEGRFHLGDAQLIVGVLDAAAVVALGRTKLYVGDERGAHEVAEIAKVMLTTTAPVVRRLAAWYLAVHSMAAGDPAQAHRWLCALGESERLSLFPLFPMEAADDPLLVRIALAAGDEELAKTVAEVAARRYELNPGVPSVAGADAHTRGLLNESREDLEQAAAILATGPRPLALAAALEDLGGARLADGDRSGAVDAFDRVLRICLDAGAARDAARARMRLRELGVRRRVQSLDRPKLGWESLTAAELEVARLAAAGCTNRGIADRLFVSPHTVNTHLRHVFEKLDVRSRVDLTRIAERH